MMTAGVADGATVTTMIDVRQCLKTRDAAV